MQVFYSLFLKYTLFIPFFPLFCSVETAKGHGLFKHRIRLKAVGKTAKRGGNGGLWATKTLKL